MKFLSTTGILAFGLALGVSACNSSKSSMPSSPSGTSTAGKTSGTISSVPIQQISATILQTSYMNEALTDHERRTIDTDAPLPVQHFQDLFRLTCQQQQDDNDQDNDQGIEKMPWVGNTCILSPDSFEYIKDSDQGTQESYESKIEVADVPLASTLDVSAFDLVETDSREDSDGYNHVTVTGTITSKALGTLQVTYDLTSVASSSDIGGFSDYTEHLTLVGPNIPNADITCSAHSDDEAQTQCQVNGTPIPEEQTTFIDVSF